MREKRTAFRKFYNRFFDEINNPNDVTMSKANFNLISVYFLTFEVNKYYATKDEILWCYEVFRDSTTQNFEQSLRDNKRDGYLHSKPINDEKGYRLTPSGVKHINSLLNFE